MARYYAIDRERIAIRVRFLPSHDDQLPIVRLVHLVVAPSIEDAPSVTGQTFAVTFPTAGNFEIVCLVHPEMFGTIHVLPGSHILPHDQAFYDEQAADERQALLDHPNPPTSGTHHSMAGMLSASVIPSTKSVIAGFGNISATPGGQESLSVVRFIDATVEIHAGDTVEWANWDPIIGHTITFGTEPVDLFDPSCGPAAGCQVLIDTDGALHAIITGRGQNVHSGFTFAAQFAHAGSYRLAMNVREMAKESQTLNFRFK
jgi:plastocyanin